MHFIVETKSVLNGRKRFDIIHLISEFINNRIIFNEFFMSFFYINKIHYDIKYDMSINVISINIITIMKFFIVIVLRRQWQ